MISACVFGLESAKMIGLPPAPFASCTATIASTTWAGLGVRVRVRVGVRVRVRIGVGS